MVLAMILGRFLSLPFLFLKYLLLSSVRDERGKTIPLSRPARLRFFLEDAGGIFVKFGDLLAMRFDLLPLPYAVQLLNLRERGGIVPAEKMFAVFHEEFGKSIRDVFESIRTEPVIVSAFYQSYRARLSGNDVVVKIQKPRIRARANADLFVLRFIASLVDDIGIFRRIALFGVIRQLEEWLSDELDCRTEAQNSAALYDHAKRHHETNIVIPMVYTDFTRRRVLVRDYIPGIKVDAVITGLAERAEETKKVLAANDIDLGKSSERLVRDLMRQYFVDGFFHVNPYPYGLLLMAKGRFSHIDFGIIGRPGQSTAPLLSFFKASLNLEFYDAASALVDFSREQTKKPFERLIEQDERSRDIFDRLLEGMKEKIAEDIAPPLNRWHETADDTRVPTRGTAAFFVSVLTIVQRYKLSIPFDAIAFLRALLMLELIGRRLDPSFDLKEPIRTFTQNVPLATTPLASEMPAEKATIDMPINEFSSLRSVDVGPELTGEANVRAEERAGAARERFDSWLSAVADRHKELYNEIKYI